MGYWSSTKDRLRQKRDKRICLNATAFVRDTLGCGVDTGPDDKQTLSCGVACSGPKSPPVTRQRADELERLRVEAALSGGVRKFKVVCIDFSDASYDALGLDAALPVDSEAYRESVADNDWCSLLQIVGPKYDADVIVVEAESVEQLTEKTAALLAVPCLACKPVALLAEEGSETAAQAAALTGGAWPVFGKPKDVALWLSNEVPGLLAVSQLVIADLSERLKSLGKITYGLHFIKRAPFAFVPFGVTVVNAMGTLKCVSRCLVRSGVVVNKKTAKKVTGLGAMTSAVEFMFDVPADVLQGATAAGIIAQASTAASAAGWGMEGAAAGLATLDAVEVATLGGVCIVTGALATVAGALTRPVLVESITRFVATQQTIAVLTGRVVVASADGGDKVWSVEEEEEFKKEK